MTNGTNGTNEANETNTTADSNDAAGGRPVIKFGTDGWRAVVGKDFNFENVEIVTRAIAGYILEKDGIDKKIIIGYDPRNQAKEFALGIPFDRKLTPSVVYGEPEIAWLGLREQDCDESYTIKKLPVTALGKAWCDNSTEGFIKVITKNGLIYGVHLVSKEASALIHTFLIAMQNNLTINDIKKTCFAHPTYSEGIFELILGL